MREGKRAKRKTTVRRQLLCEPGEAAARSAPGQGIPRALLVPQAATGGEQAARRDKARHGAPMAAGTARAALPFNAARPRVPSGRRAPRAGQVRRGRALVAAAPPPPRRTAPAGSPGTGEAAAAGSRPRLSGKRPPARRRRPRPGAYGGGSGAREAPAPLLNSSAMRGRGRRGRDAAGAPEAATPQWRGGPEAALRVTAGSGPRRAARPGRGASWCAGC